MSIHIEKRDKGWRVRVIWYENGKQHTKSKQGFATKSAAKQYGIELESKRNNGLNIGVNPPFNEYFKDWIEIYVKPKVSIVTYHEYLRHLNQLTSYFGSIRLKNLTRQQYQGFISEYGKDHVLSSTKKINNHIRACVKSAILDGLISLDFTQGISLSGNSDREKNVDYLNLSEIKLLLNYCIENRNPNFPGFYVIITAIYTGARLGEILGLTWDDLSSKSINITKSWNYKLHEIGPTKNKFSVREISIPQKLYTMLIELKQNNSNMVFYSASRKGIPNTRSMNNLLKRTLHHLEINRSGFHFHSLRHSHVAFLIAQGFDIYTISKRLGHADTTITSRTYAYLLDEYKKETDERLRLSLQKI